MSERDEWEERQFKRRVLQRMRERRAIAEESDLRHKVSIPITGDTEEARIDREELVLAEGEKKFFDTGHFFLIDANIEIPAGGQLCLVPQGVTMSQRIGRLIVIESIQMRGTFFFESNNISSGTGAVCLMLVLDKNANGAAASIAGGATGMWSNSDAFAGFANLQQSERFVVLKRCEYVVTSGAGSQLAFGGNTVLHNFYYKCEIPIMYDSTASTGALTTIRSNNVFLVAGTNAITDDIIRFSGATRIRYRDG